MVYKYLYTKFLYTYSKQFKYRYEYNILMSENIDFTLPYKDFVLGFIKLSQNDKLKVVELGLKCLNTVNIQTQLWNNEEWKDKMNNIKSENKRLKETIKQNKKEISIEIDRIVKKNKDENEVYYENLKGRLDTKYKNEIENLESRVESLRQKNQDIYKDTVLEYSVKIEEIVDKNEEKIEKIRAGYEKKLETERELREENIKRKSNSTIKGQDGENFLYFELNSRFPSAEVIDTHKESARGDFIMKDCGLSILIEAKNYKKNVTKPEITKFYRDIDNNKDIDCGLFLSLESGVCAKKDFSVEIRDEKPIIFLHNISKNMKHIEIAVSYLKMILGSEIDLSNKETIDRIKNDIPMIKKIWNRMKQKVKKFEQDMMDCIFQQENFVKNIYESIKIKY